MLLTNTRKPIPVDLPTFPPTINIAGRIYVRESQLVWLMAAYEAVSLGRGPPPPPPPPKDDRFVPVKTAADQLGIGRRTAGRRIKEAEDAGEAAA
jgi:hypothetical protein